MDIARALKSTGHERLQTEMLLLDSR